MERVVTALLELSLPMAAVFSSSTAESSMACISARRPAAG